MCGVLTEPKVITGKHFFLQKRLFLEFLLSGGQTVDLRSNMRAQRRRCVKRAIECAFSGRFSSAGSRVMCRFVEKCWKRSNLTFGEVWWPDLWPDQKIDRSLSVIIIYAHSIVAYRGLKLVKLTIWYYLKPNIPGKPNKKDLSGGDLLGVQKKCVTFQ